MVCWGKTDPAPTGLQCVGSGPVETLEVHNVHRSRKSNVLGENFGAKGLFW